MKYLILLTLSLPPILSSTLVFPTFTAPIRIPIYLISIFFSFFLFFEKKNKFLKVILIMGMVFTCGMFLSSIINIKNINLNANLRQVFVYSSLFFCSYVGYLSYRHAQSQKLDFIKYIIQIHTLLFIYGIYTYFAQVYNMFEPLWFLRPMPQLTGESSIYSSVFFGWASSSRAYSVWYEPSYASIVMAAVLPLVFFNSNKMVNVLFLLSALLFCLLTYSRSTWLIYIVFLSGYFCFTIVKPTFRSTWIGVIFIILVIPGSLLLQFLLLTAESDISSIIRFYTVIKGAIEASPYFLYGLGSPYLIEEFLFDVQGHSHIHNSFIAMFHWIGISGFVLLFLPFYSLFKLTKKKNIRLYWIVLLFSTLVTLAFCIGGALVSLSTFWYFFGIYYAEIESRPRNSSITRKPTALQPMAS